LDQGGGSHARYAAADGKRGDGKRGDGGTAAPPAGVGGMTRLSDAALDTLFRTARTADRFADRPVPADLLTEAVVLAGLGPTAFNQQPLRLLFVQGAEARARLSPCLSSGNRAKTLAAPVTAIVCWDLDFVDDLPQHWPAADVRGFYPDDAARRASAQRNATLQAGYFLLAARALGLACGPMSGFKPDLVAETFLTGPRARWEVNFLLNLGFPADLPPDPAADPSGAPRPRLPRLPPGRIAQVI
jgi:3-hydroxypropanoate dehydrogenase